MKIKMLQNSNVIIKRKEEKRRTRIFGFVFIPHPGKVMHRDMSSTEHEAVPHHLVTFTSLSHKTSVQIMMGSFMLL